METTYRDAAIALWGGAGALAHAEYARHRDAWFGTRVPAQIPIVIGITAYGHCAGLTRGDWPDGPRITLESRGFARGWRWVSDVILHEMIHVALFGDGVSAGHKGEPWYAEVRRLSSLVFSVDVSTMVRRGADRKSVRVLNPAYTGPGRGEPRTLVRKKRDWFERGDAVDHGDVARWPHSIRMADYYQDDTPIPCPSY